MEYGVERINVEIISICQHLSECNTQISIYFISTTIRFWCCCVSTITIKYPKRRTDMHQFYFRIKYFHSFVTQSTLFVHTMHSTYVVPRHLVVEWTDTNGRSALDFDRKNQCYFAHNNIKCRTNKHFNKFCYGRRCDQMNHESRHPRYLSLSLPAAAHCIDDVVFVRHL